VSFIAGYDPELDGRVPNEFATAAFRLGHTLLQERLRRASPDYETDDSLFLSQVIHFSAIERGREVYNEQVGRTALA